MKKALITMLAALQILPLTGCGQKIVCKYPLPESTDTAEQAVISPEEDDRWVILEQAYFYDGDLREQFQYTYEDGHQAEILSGLYSSLDETMFFTREVIEYDTRAGHASGSKSYDAETEDLVSMQTNEYDGENRLIRSRKYRYDGALDSETTYTYTPQGITMEHAIYDGSETPAFRTVSEKTPDGQQIASKMYGIDGALMSSTRGEFDEAGKLIRQVRESASQFLRVNSETEFLYDEEGVLRQSITRSSESDVTVTEYRYDVYGNKVEELTTQNGKEISRTAFVWGRMHNNEIAERSETPAENVSFTLVENAPREKAPEPAVAATVPVQAGYRIALANGRILAVCNTGEVLYARAGKGNSYLSPFEDWKWKDIVAVDMVFNGAMGRHMGLRADGSVVCDGFSFYDENETEGWENIVRISALNDLSYGLTADGRMVALGENKNGECDMKGVTDAVEFFTESHFSKYAIVLRKDGSITAVGAVPDWLAEIDLTRFTDVKEVVMLYGYLFVLKNDGTVESTASNSNSASLQGITRIFNAEHGVIGLREDGTVCAVCKFSSDEIDEIVSKWSGIVDVKATLDQVIGLRADGTLVSTAQRDLGAFTDLMEVYVFDRYNHPDGAMIVGVRNDGSVVTNVPELQEQVAAWKLF